MEKLMIRNHKQLVKDAILERWGHEPDSLDDLARCVIDSINHHFSRAAQRTRVVGFVWNIQYNNAVSNTHSSPIMGEKNWHRNPHIPTGYPGYQGRVWIRYDQPPISFASDAFNSSLTYTGTGGGGSYDGIWSTISRLHYQKYGNQTKTPYPRPNVYSWDYRFFASDWPALPDPYREMLFDILRTNHMLAYNHKFVWEDPGVFNRDRQFRESVKITRG